MRLPSPIPGVVVSWVVDLNLIGETVSLLFKIFSQVPNKNISKHLKHQQNVIVDFHGRQLCPA